MSWTVIFSKSVTGVDSNDFTLVNGGLGAPAPAITGVTGSGTTYTVTASTGTGSGTLQLNLTDNDSIIDALNNPLGGAGNGNGNFAGQQYNVDRTKPTVTGVTSVQASGGTAGLFQAGDSLRITFDEDMTGVAASDVEIKLSRASNSVNTRLFIEGVTLASDTGSSTGGTSYFAGSGGRTISSINGTISLASSGALSNNVVVVTIGSVAGDTPDTGAGALVLVFDGGITDPAGNVPNSFTTLAAFTLF